MKKAFLGLTLLLASGCVQTENSNSDDASLGQGGSPGYLNFVSIARTSCVPCHNYHTLSEDQMIAQSLVIPGNAEASPLYNSLVGSTGSQGNKNMPQGGALPAGDVAAIAAWINTTTN